MKQARVIEYVAEREQGVDTHAGGRCILELTADEGVKHPRGNGDLDAIRKLDDKTLCGLAP